MLFECNVCMASREIQSLSIGLNDNYEVAREVSKISLHSLRRNFAPEENKFEMKEGVTANKCLIQYC